MIDRQRLIKLMMMTTSTNDGEALTAVRKANAMLKVEGSDWSKFLSSPSSIGLDRRPQQPPPRPPMKPTGRGTTDTHKYPPPKDRFTDNDIPRMLQSLMRDTKGDFRNLIESLYQQWNDKHYLTERQYEVVINAYEREK